MKIRKIKFVVFIGLLLLLSACGTKEESASKELTLPSDGLTKMIVDHRNGEVKITGTDSDQIEVSAAVKADGVSMDKLDLTLEAREDTAVLNAQFKAQFLAMGTGSVDLEVKVPESLTLEVTSHRDGKITLSDLSSGATISNINGEIQASDISGTLEIDNRDGDINARNISSDVIVHNINGHIVVDGVTGSAEIHVGDGSLDLDHVDKDAMITQSGNGNIQIGEVKGKVTQNKKN
ncbi:hypothetical protein ACE6ED_14270 [Paenibacillus sp. CN-4]|uniref:hypothetical protein n=1 Tax=Paenibacillus nanchangensis TaxID=3348343 RepID=UPI00397B2DF9